MKKINNIEMRNIVGGAYICLVCRDRDITHISYTYSGNVMHHLTRHPWASITYKKA